MRARLYFLLRVRFFIFCSEVFVFLIYADGSSGHSLGKWGQNHGGRAVHDAQLGQMLFYVVAHQIRVTSVFPYPKPVMGLFMTDGNVSHSMTLKNRVVSMSVSASVIF